MRRPGVRQLALALALAAGLPLLGIGGCAGRAVQFHRLPPDTPAADNAAAVAKARQMEQAAARARELEAGKRREAAVEGAAPAQPPPPVTPAQAPPMKTYDPWAPFNRFTYRFNARFDEAVFLPVADGYRRLVPSPLRTGVHNFFGNVSEIDSVVNYALQGRLGRMVRSLGRFVVNTTIGLGGLFDPASGIGLEQTRTGFGATLAKWGMHPGPYLVIPLYGPSTLREGIGLAADYGTLYEIDPAQIYRGAQSWALGGLNAVDKRAHVDFRYYASGSPFEYETIRFLYVRKQLIEDAGLHRTRALPKPNPELPAGE